MIIECDIIKIALLLAFIIYIYICMLNGWNAARTCVIVCGRKWPSAVTFSLLVICVASINLLEECIG